MEEPQRIEKLFQNLYNGNPWLDITLVGTLSDIHAKKAAKKPVVGNSIWEISNHIISWREDVLKRVKGTTVTTPADNYFTPVHDTSETAWKETLERLETSQRQWTDFLKQMKDEELASIYPPNGYTHYEHIHGIIQHDAYHLGQIVLIAKHLV